MAEASISWAQDQFSCAVCLDLLKDPVTIPCGHSYCMSCITHCWNQKNLRKVYSCPQCRQTFSLRPVLGKNTILAEMVEKLKKTKVQAAVYAHCSAGDVLCDVCTEIKHEAVKSCLMCLNSYCEDHLQQHENLFKGKKHNLIEATGRLKEIICPQHDRLLDVYCRTDQLCVCYLCTIDEHKDHDTVSSTAERTDKQAILDDTKRKYHQRMEKIEKELKELRETVMCHKHSAQIAVHITEGIFRHMILSMERRRSEVTQHIRDQEKTAVSQAEEHLKRLEQEIEDLRKRDAELDEVSYTHDDVTFIQSFQSLPVSLGCEDKPIITITSQLSFDDVKKSVSKLNEKLDDFCKDIDKMSNGVTCSELSPTNEPKTRQDFLQYSCQLTLDTNTVNKNLRLSKSNRVISWIFESQHYPDHPDRFDQMYQVLCKESVCGRCYWEVEWSVEEMFGVSISVSYKSINRKGRGRESLFGGNDQSWCFSRHFNCYTFSHKRNCTDIPLRLRSPRIGMYVDHSAGILSFYSISDTMRLIHRVQTTFTQPLYPGFRLGSGTRLKLCEP
ncbi:tripartite motif-containing protein 16-like isoform X2 [Triplophysa rosa]|uniref:FinTRIM family n=1 Tax=Triplophysa rosa TaxID=992332 RepID=A0A9W7TF97_TRIRA|nr:tripartite motif-containing protein 16-like isoform X2 [Triplophysa rosa]KAI7795411.1 finTRIM family [Triplophysa rosa]